MPTQHDSSAVDYHIDITGAPGNSEMKGFEGQIQVLSFSFHMTQATSFGSSTGGGAGKASIGDMHFVHHVDKSTPKLMEACATGQHLAKAVLTCRKAGGSPVDFWKITFTDVLVSGVQQGQQQGAHPTETISLAFAEYGVEYQEQDNKGAKKGGPIKHGFNVQKGQKV